MRTGLFLTGLFLVVGCNGSSPPAALKAVQSSDGTNQAASNAEQPASSVERPPDYRSTTFFVAGMNQRLKIL
jgi:hypothetical protein